MKVTLSMGTVALLYGCAASSVFTSYPAQIQPIKQQVQSKQYTPAMLALNEHRDDADKMLYMMELVIDAFNANDEKAKLSASGTGTAAAAMLTNDNAIPYTGYGYERVFVHHFQAMNYLFDKDMEGALVEVRRANEVQTSALKEHESEVDDAEKKARENKVNNENFMASFQSMDALAGRVKNSFQNAYTFYISGLLYEASRNENDAYIDYKKALEIFPDNPYLQKDVLRLAKKLAMTDDLARFETSFKVKPGKPEANQGEIVVLYEHDFAPVKQEVKVGVATIGGLHHIAFPIYKDIWRDSIPLSVSVAGNTVGTTSPIVYVQALAAKALREELPLMMVRQVLRVVAKKKMADEAGDKFGGLAGLGTMIFNAVSENADLRSWLTLPNDAQIMRGYVAEGEQELQLTNGTAQGAVKVKIVPGHTTLVRVVGTGPTLQSDFVVM